MLTAGVLPPRDEDLARAGQSLAGILDMIAPPGRYRPTDRPTDKMLALLESL
jgi:hypothetical protein